VARLPRGGMASDLGLTTSALSPSAGQPGVEGVDGGGGDVGGAVAGVRLAHGRGSAAAGTHPPGSGQPPFSRGKNRKKENARQRGGGGGSRGPVHDSVLVPRRAMDSEPGTLLVRGTRAPGRLGPYGRTHAAMK